MYDTTTSALKRFLPPVEAMVARRLLLTGFGTTPASGWGINQIDLTVREPLPAFGAIERPTLGVGVAGALLRPHKESA